MLIITWPSEANATVKKPLSFKVSHVLHSVTFLISKAIEARLIKYPIFNDISYNRYTS